MWCELALSLGSTIAELQDKMTSREFNTWLSYRAKYGPLNPVRMYDQMGAIVASTVYNAHAKKPSKPTDFMPYHKAKDNDGDEVVDAEQFIKILELSGAKRGRQCR